MDATIQLYIETSKKERITRDDLITELQRKGINFFSEKHNQLDYFVEKEADILRLLLSNKLNVGIETTRDKLQTDELFMKFCDNTNPYFFALFDFVSSSSSKEEDEIQFARNIRKNWGDYLEIMVGLDHLGPKNGLQTKFSNVLKNILLQFNEDCPLILEKGIYRLKNPIYKQENTNYFLIKDDQPVDKAE